MIRAARMLCSAAIVLLAACGEAAAPSSTCLVATTAAPRIHAGAGPITAQSDAGSIAPGATATFTVTAAGPVTYQADCDTPLEVTITDLSDISVPDTGAPAHVAGPCGSVALAAGQTATYTTKWTPDPTLPNGVYTVTLTLGDQAPLMLALPVHTAASAC